MEIVWCACGEAWAWGEMTPCLACGVAVCPHCCECLGAEPVVCEACVEREQETSDATNE